MFAKEFQMCDSPPAVNLCGWQATKIQANLRHKVGSHIVSLLSCETLRLMFEHQQELVKLLQEHWHVRLGLLHDVVPLLPGQLTLALGEEVAQEEELGPRHGCFLQPLPYSVAQPRRAVPQAAVHGGRRVGPPHGPSPPAEEFYDAVSASVHVWDQCLDFCNAEIARADNTDATNKKRNVCAVTAAWRN